jgi:hypothetical protein
VRLIATLSLATAALAFALPPALADEQVTPNALVTALEQVYGVHPGQRRNHTKGTCATGSFVGLPEATSYSRSALSRARPSLLLRASHSVVATPMHPTLGRDRAEWRLSSSSPTAASNT